MSNFCRGCGVLLLSLVATAAVLAADTPEQQACIDIAKRDADGTASDRFMREWCQRNVAAASAATEKPATASPQVPRAETPIYRQDDTAEQLNSSRLPPGYHCHLMKFGERICHGGMD